MVYTNIPPTVETQDGQCCFMVYHKDTKNGGGGWGESSGSISAARYLVLLGDVLLVILLHLPELGLQPTQLDLHLFYVLQVPLSPLVQHLNGLGHVLDLG